MADFGKAMEEFGSDYTARTGQVVEGHYLIRALVRWTAGAIASAPAEERAGLLLMAMRFLHQDLDAAESRQGQVVVSTPNSGTLN